MPFIKGHKLNIGNKYAMKSGTGYEDRHKAIDKNSKEKKCIECDVTFRAFNYRFERTKFCSRKCQGSFQCTKNLAGKPHSQETKDKMRDIKLKSPIRYWLGKTRLSMTGENNVRWILDRSELKESGDRRSVKYRDWRKQVWLRDKFTCRIADNNCDGRIEAHHILGYAEHVELRYNINNGITLCHAHHPRKRAEEKRLVPTFQELVLMSVSK